MILEALKNQQVLTYFAKRMVDGRISPTEASTFLSAEMIRCGLRKFQGHQVRTALWLGMHRNTLDRQMDKFKINPREFRPIGRRRKKKPTRSVTLAVAQQEQRV